MSQATTIFVGNEFSVPTKRKKVAVNPEVTETIIQAKPAMPVMPVLAVQAAPAQVAATIPLTTSRFNSQESTTLTQKLMDLVHENSFIVFAALFLLVAGSGIKVGGDYYGARLLHEASSDNSSLNIRSANSVAGLNIEVPSSDLQNKLTQITSQPATLTVGTQTVTLTPANIKSWLTITANSDSTDDSIHVSAQAIDNSLMQIANGYVKAPVNQVSVTHTDGITPSGVIVLGVDGTALSDPSGLMQQSVNASKNVLGGNTPMQFNTPIKTVAYSAVTPSAFGKLLEVDLTTKRMYAYQNGQLVNTFLVSAGKPTTPTPVGEFKIWDKLTSQTMTGPGYVQPNVPWVNYFDHSGDAVHGVYWRAASVFGNVNTSHGCVGVAVNQAEWVYNWAPIGTTVINYL